MVQFHVLSRFVTFHLYKTSGGFFSVYDPIYMDKNSIPKILHSSGDTIVKFSKLFSRKQRLHQFEPNHEIDDLDLHVRLQKHITRMLQYSF
jgi:hypothetical protein